MKIYIKLDAQTIPPSVYSFISTQTAGLTALEHGLHLFEFSPLVFTHAQKLLSAHPATYGRDLSIYLSNVITHFDRTDANKEISLGIGDADFKRKMSEDMGIGIAALFMNKVFNAEWRSMLQIPGNKQLGAKRPDFQCDDMAGNRYIFEGKGTTSMHTLETQITKGKEQVKKYPGPVSSKYVIASYFSGDASSFPSTTFVYDPPHLGTPIESREDAIKAHYIHVLHFLGLHDQAKAYRELLAREIKPREEPGFPLPYAASVPMYDKKIDPLRNTFFQSWATAPDPEISKIGEYEFATFTQVATAGKAQFTITTGLRRDVFDALNSYQIEALAGITIKPETTEDFSILDDGTLLMIKSERPAED